MLNEDLRVGQDGAGDGQELHLTLGYVRGFLVEHQVIAIRQGAHKVIDVSRFGRRDNLRIVNLS